MNGRKPSLLSSGADPITATRNVGENMENSGDIITGIGIVTSPFGGGVLIIPGEITSGTGTAIQILVDFEEGDIKSGIIKGVSVIAPARLSKPLRKGIEKYFGRMAKEAIEKGDKKWLKSLKQGKTVIDSKVKVFEFSSGKAIQDRLNEAFKEDSVGEQVNIEDKDK